MNREIKFRGKRLDNKEWIIGSLLLINDKAYIYPSNSGDLEDIDFGFGFTEVDPATVGQFAGLLDKNGKEIYEGDIVRYIGNDCGDYFNSAVKWEGAGFNPIAFMYECGAIEDMQENDQDLCIVGNIYDNPEILQQTNNK